MCQNRKIGPFKIPKTPFLDRFWSSFERVWPIIVKIGLMLFIALLKSQNRQKRQKPEKKVIKKWYPQKSGHFLDSARSGKSKTGKNQKSKREKQTNLKTEKNKSTEKKVVYAVPLKCFFKNVKNLKNDKFSKKTSNGSMVFAPHSKNGLKLNKKNHGGYPMKSEKPLFAKSEKNKLVPAKP